MDLLRRLLPALAAVRPSGARIASGPDAPSDAQAAPVSDVTAVVAARLRNAQAIVAAAGRAEVPLAVAAALAELESGGRNIYGHDAGGVFAEHTELEVTRENLAEFRRRVADGERSNGVGPAQITWPPFFERADREGIDLADPEDSLTLGLTLLKENAGGDLSPAGLERAGTLYNAGTLANGVTDYGRRLAGAAEQWATRLAER